MPIGEPPKDLFTQPPGHVDIVQPIELKADEESISAQEKGLFRFMAKWKRLGLRLALTSDVDAGSGHWIIRVQGAEETVWAFQSELRHLKLDD